MYQTSGVSRFSKFGRAISWSFRFVYNLAQARRLETKAKKAYDVGRRMDAAILYMKAGYLYDDIGWESRRVRSFDEGRKASAMDSLIISEGL